MNRASTAAAETLAGSAPADRERAEPAAPRAPLLIHPLPVALVAIVVAALAFASYPTIARSTLAAFLAAVLVVLAATDLERRIIPNRIVLPAIAVVFVAHVAIDPSRTIELIVAPLAAALFLFLPNLINGSAIGMGDVKLALLLGVGLGVGVVAGAPGRIHGHPALCHRDACPRGRSGAQTSVAVGSVPRLRRSRGPDRSTASVAERFRQSAALAATSRSAPRNAGAGSGLATPDAQTPPARAPPGSVMRPGCRGGAR